MPSRRCAGRIYLDGGLGAAAPVIARLFAPRIAALPAPETLKDAKTRLQEYLQSRSLALPRYAVSRIEGEASRADLPRQLRGAGAGAALPRVSGSSRRRAEQDAARRMLEEIETPPDRPS